MNSILSFMESVIGTPPDYFTVGAGNQIQWHYGHLIEYFFAGMVLLISLSTLYKLLIKILKGE